ncbi:hypothetical protein [Corynebacterium sp.]|uniref:hypothetical protein n=1 Tax=Corynebacterium sp. TaxID=1720 RepID=UPI002A90E87E|nr:hypothetical protein [Corynebacterium sp.]MDY5784529.1 hypothetical protein [Corynebacterium sp.]
MTHQFVSTLTKQWNRLSSGEKTAVGILATIDGIGKSTALASLVRTPKEKVRGSKLVWGPIIATVNTLGWIAWFLIGSKK